MPDFADYSLTTILLLTTPLVLAGVLFGIFLSRRITRRRTALGLSPDDHMGEG